VRNTYSWHVSKFSFISRFERVNRAVFKWFLLLIFALFAVYGGEGLAENVRIPSYVGRGLKLLKKILNTVI